MEKLKFCIGLSGTYWDKKPQYSVWLNNVKFSDGTIAEDSGVVRLVEFEAELEDDQEHLLKIRLENKADRDTIVDPATGNITKDMLLNIESIRIDDIDVENLRWSASEYTPDDASINKLDNCVNLGWNGTYEFKFTTPFYLWLLENM